VFVGGEEGQEGVGVALVGVEEGDAGGDEGLGAEGVEGAGEETILGGDVVGGDLQAGTGGVDVGGEGGGGGDFGGGSGEGGEALVERGGGALLEGRDGGKWVHVEDVRLDGGRGK
jgi:hypothetical protein